MKNAKTLYKKSGIVNETMWLRHSARVPQETCTQKVFYENPGGRGREVDPRKMERRR